MVHVPPVHVFSRAVLFCQKVMPEFSESVRLAANIMENICANHHQTGATKPKQPRVSFAKSNYKARKSLASPLLGGDDGYAGMNDFTLPPLIIPEEEEIPKPEKHIKKRLSLGTIAEQRQELELMKESMALDEEVEYLNTTMTDMEEMFKQLYAKVTYERLMAEYANSHRKKHKPVDFAKIVSQIQLNRYKYTEWAELIEQALAEHIH